MEERKPLENIKKEIERIKEDCIFSAKGHFESAKWWRYWNYGLMIASITFVCMSLVFDEFITKLFFFVFYYWLICVLLWSIISWCGLIMVVIALAVCVCLSLLFLYSSSGFISVLSGFITILLIFLNPQEKYLSHQNSGNKFLALRNKASFLLEVTFQQMNIKQQTKCLKKLHSKRDRLNSNSLPVHWWGYKSAKKQIEKDKNTQYDIDKRK